MKNKNYNAIEFRVRSRDAAKFIMDAAENENMDLAKAFCLFSLCVANSFIEPQLRYDFKDAIITILDKMGDKVYEDGYDFSSDIIEMLKEMKEGA